MQRNSVKIEICTPLLSRWGFFYMNMWIPASKSALPEKRRSKWCDLCFSISMDLLRIKSVENHLRFGKSRATPFTSDAWHVEKHGRIVMKMRQSKESWNPNQPGFYGMQLMWTPVPHLWQRPTSVQGWHSWNRECYEHSSNSQWSQVYQNCSGGGFGPVSPSLPLGLRVIPVNAWLSGWKRFVLCCLISTCCLSSLWSILLCSIPSSTWFHLTGSSLSHWCGSIPQQPHGGIDSFGCHNAMGWWVISWSKWLWWSDWQQKIECKDSSNVCTLSSPWCFWYRTTRISCKNRVVDPKGVGCDANAEVEGRRGVLCLSRWKGVLVRNHEHVWQIMKIDSEDEEDAQDLSMQSFSDQFKAFLLLCSRLYLRLSASWFISLLQAFGW